jgi:hypothetical protein
MSATVSVVAEREAPPPRIVRIRYRIDIVSDAAPHKIEQLHKNIRMFGTITNTLRAACDVSGEISATTAPPEGVP